MNKALFSEFVKYCDSQPEDNEIDHSSWSACAVGEFFESKGISELGCGSEEIEDLLGAHCFEDDFELNPLATKISAASNLGRYGTYGEFTKLLKDYL